MRSSTYFIALCGVLLAATAYSTNPKIVLQKADGIDVGTAILWDGETLSIPQHTDRLAWLETNMTELKSLFHANSCLSRHTCTGANKIPITAAATTIGADDATCCTCSEGYETSINAGVTSCLDIDECAPPTTRAEAGALLAAFDIGGGLDNPTLDFTSFTSISACGLYAYESGTSFITGHAFWGNRQPCNNVSDYSNDQWTDMYASGRIRLTSGCKDGTCVNTAGGHTCTCKRNYTGSNCEIPPAWSPSRCGTPFSPSVPPMANNTYYTFFDVNGDQSDYSNEQDCWWRIEAPANSTLTIRLNYVKLEWNDFLHIWDGANEMAPLLSKKGADWGATIDQEEAEYFYSSSNVVMVKIDTDHMSTNEGFSLSYAKNTTLS